MTFTSGVATELKLIKNCLYSECKLTRVIKWQCIYAKQLACFSVANLDTFCDIITDNTKRIWILLKKNNRSNLCKDVHRIAYCFVKLNLVFYSKFQIITVAFSYLLSLETWSIRPSRQQTTKALIRLCGCAGGSAPLLFAYGIKRIWILLKKNNRSNLCKDVHRIA